MKSYLTTIIFLFFTLSCFSQDDPVKQIESLLKPPSSIPADQVFLHLDRNLYQPGDTIRFQAYIRDRQTGIFETKSISLYVLLVNTGHKTIDSARFRIMNSTASGWLKIPFDAPHNDYSVLAFTSRMMNYNSEYVFSSPVRIDKLRPAPIHNNQKPGNEKPAALQMEASEKSIDLRFLPEGGTFINGISQRLTFNAVNSLGAGFKTEGTIINQKGEKICDFKSGQLGPGVVTFTPMAGNSYFATLKGAEFSGMKWPLPVAEENGVSLSASSLYNGVLSIGVEGKNGGDSSYYISLVMNNVVVLAKEFIPDPDFQMKVSTEELPSGTAYITLFNSSYKPVAERLIFVNHQKKLNIGISASAPTYNRGDLTELTIKATDNDGNNTGAVVSVSVIDSVSGFYDRLPFPDIETTLLFEKEFYDNLPVNIKLKGLANLGEEDIDLLLMTYGWRKFRLREPSDTMVVRDFKNYDYLKFKNTGTSKKTREEISLVSLEGSESYSILTDKNKEGFLYFDSLSASVRRVMILPDKNNLRNVYPVIVEFPENKYFIDKAKLNKTGDFTQPMNVGYKRSSFTDFGLDSAIMIESVTIKGAKSPSKKIVNKYEQQYQNTSPYTLKNLEFKSAVYFESILFQMHPYKIDTKNKLVYLGLRTGRYETPALIVVDDNPLWAAPSLRESKWLSTYAEISDMPASNISSVTMVKGQQGFARYGEAALGGIIFVTTNGKAMREGTYEEAKSSGPPVINDLAKPIRIYRSEIEYYVPKKEEVQFDPEFQFRPTVLWENELILNGTGPGKLIYPNNLVRGTVIIIVNGVSFNNIPFSKSIKYIIN